MSLSPFAALDSTAWSRCELAFFGLDRRGLSSGGVNADDRCLDARSYYEQTPGIGHVMVNDIAHVLDDAIYQRPRCAGRVCPGKP